MQISSKTTEGYRLDKNCVLVSNRKWNRAMVARLTESTGCKFTLLTKPEELTFDTLEKLNPRFVFLPHWSHRIPENIFNNFECVIFHMTDLPYGRGGSPLQNLISRGIYETKITALRCVEEMDAGPVYMKEPFSLYGSAEEIYLRASKMVESMIVDMLDKFPEPKEQEGTPTIFKRRKPEDSNIGNIESLQQIFDLIRMLDADGYPNAFVDVGPFKLEFTRASIKTGQVVADVQITLNEEISNDKNRK